MCRTHFLLLKVMNEKLWLVYPASYRSLQKILCCQEVHHCQNALHRPGQGLPAISKREGNRKIWILCWMTMRQMRMRSAASLQICGQDRSLEHIPGKSLRQIMSKRLLDCGITWLICEPTLPRWNLSGQNTWYVDRLLYASAVQKIHRNVLWIYSLHCS